MVERRGSEDDLRTCRKWLVVDGLWAVGWSVLAGGWWTTAGLFHWVWLLFAAFGYVGFGYWWHTVRRRVRS